MATRLGEVSRFLGVPGERHRFQPPRQWIRLRVSPSLRHSLRFVSCGYGAMQANIYVRDSVEVFPLGS